METKKVTFDCIKEDQEALARITAHLAKTQGPVSVTVAIRFALRKAVKGLAK